MKRRLHLALLASSLSVLALAEPAWAQTATGPKEKIGVATVTFAAKCPHDNRVAATNEFLGKTFLPILGDFAGTLAGGGLTLLSEALGDAARASAIGGEGRHTFDYYRIDGKTGKRSAQIGSDDMKCLIVVIHELPSDPVTANSTPKPMLTVESNIHLFSSGFVVEPVYIHYKTKLPGGSEKRLAAELDITLAGPLTYNNGTAGETIYGIARIKLPNLMPGDVWQGDSLTVRSGIMPHRTPDASVGTDARVAAIENVRTAKRTTENAFRKIASLLGLVPEGADWKCGDFAYACRKLVTGPGTVKNADIGGLVDRALKGTDYPDTTKTELGSALTSYRDAQYAEGVAQATLDALPAETKPDVASGSTSIIARLFILTNEKKFLKLLSKALGDAGTALKPAVSGAIQGQPEWTAADTQYATAMATVSDKQLALDVAMQGSDQAAIQKAKTDLIKAKADANEKAVAAKRPIPFPGLLP